MTTEPWTGWKPPRAIPANQSQPVLWWLLISAIEDFSIHTGLGLADTWTEVHRGDYTAAHESFLWWLGYHDGVIQGIHDQEGTP